MTSVTAPLFFIEAKTAFTSSASPIPRDRWTAKNEFQELPLPLPASYSRADANAQ